MDKPKCKLCDSRHYSYEPHKFANTVANIANEIANHVRGGDKGGSRKRGEVRDQVREPDRNNSSQPAAIQVQEGSAQDAVGAGPDPRQAELPGKRVHPEVQASGRVVPGPEGPVEVLKPYKKWREANPDLYRERQREYMRKRRCQS